VYGTGTECCICWQARAAHVHGTPPTTLPRLLQAERAKTLLGSLSLLFPEEAEVASAAVAADVQRRAEREERLNRRRERRERRELTLTQQQGHVARTSAWQQQQQAVAGSGRGEPLSNAQERRRPSQTSSLCSSASAARGGLDIEDELADAFDEKRRRGVRSIAGGSLRPHSATSARSGGTGSSGGGSSVHRHSGDEAGSRLTTGSSALDGGAYFRFGSSGYAPRGLSGHALSLLLLGRFASGGHFDAARRAANTAAAAAGNDNLNPRPAAQQAAAAADDPLQALALELFVSALASLSPTHIHQAVVVHVLQVRRLRGWIEALSGSSCDGVQWRGYG
jgi:hypothetical protein